MGLGTLGEQFGGKEFRFVATLQWMLAVWQLEARRIWIGLTQCQQRKGDQVTKG